MNHPLLFPNCCAPNNHHPLERLVDVIGGVEVYGVAGVYIRWCSYFAKAVGFFGEPDAHRSLSIWEPESEAVAIAGEDREMYVEVSARLQHYLPRDLSACPVEVYNLRTRRFLRTEARDFGSWLELGAASVAAARALGIVGDRILPRLEERWLSYVVYLCPEPPYAFPRSTQGHNG